MKRPRILFAAAVLALAACATTAPSLDQAQRRAVSAIQTAQKASTAALDAGTISAAQDRSTQQRLSEARAAVLAAKTADEATAAAHAAGAQP